MINSVVLVDSLTLWLGVCYFVVRFGICFDLRCFACWCMYCLVLGYGVILRVIVFWLWLIDFYLWLWLRCFCWLLIGLLVVGCVCVGWFVCDVVIGLV